MGSGLDALLVHMVDVLEETESKINPSIGPIIVGSIRLVFAGIIPFVIRRFAPKILFITCQALSTLSMVLLAVYIYLQSNHPDIPYLDHFDWMPLTVVILCSILRSIGIAPVLSILLSELYPTDIRTQAIGITEASFFASSAICVRFYPDMKHTMGLDGLCIYYGALCLACSAWGAFSIPDNRGKSLVKVEEMYVEENVDTKSVDAKAETSMCTTRL